MHNVTSALKRSLGRNVSTGDVASAADKENKENEAANGQQTEQHNDEGGSYKSKKAKKGKKKSPKWNGDPGMSMWKVVLEFLVGEDDEQVVGVTQYPRVVMALQVLSCVVLTILILGPLMYVETVAVYRRGIQDKVSTRISKGVSYGSELGKSFHSIYWKHQPSVSETESDDNYEDESPSEPAVWKEKPKEEPSKVLALQKISQGYGAHWVVQNQQQGSSGKREEDRLAVQDGFSVDRNTLKSAWFQKPFHEKHASQEQIVREQISSMAQEAVDKLNNEKIECLPKVCQATNGFYNPSDDITKLFLVSFPGAGNTWLRTLIRSGTRKFTGSVYTDKKLAYNQGFQGEMLNPQDPRTSIVKSHFPMWKVGNPNKWNKFKSAILILRSPFDSILSELNRIQSGQSHTGIASNEYLLGEGINRAHTLTSSYNQLTNFWEGLNSYNTKTRSAVTFEGSGTKDFKGTRLRDVTGMFSYDIRPLRFGEGFPVFTMFYEDFQRDYIGALAHLFAFIKLQLKDKMPSVYESLLCTLNSEKLFVHTKRDKNGQINPFISVAEDFCRNFAFTWNTAKWGECNGQLQSDRSDLKRVQWRGKYSIPTEVCPV